MESLKNTIINVPLFFIVFLFANTSLAIPPIPEEIILLIAGKVVSPQLNEEVSIEEVQIGNSLDFLVRSNVVVNEKVVICSTTIAEGWVKKKTTSCEGYYSIITIIVENVRIVDG